MARCDADSNFYDDDSNVTDDASGYQRNDDANFFEKIQ